MYNNLSKALKKVIIIFLVITLTYSNFVLVGSNMVKGLISYALDEVESIENKVTLEQELVTNRTYEIDGEEKRIIQIAVTTGIEEDKYPIRMSHITLKTNIIENALEDVKVTSLNRNSYTSGKWEIKDEKIEISLINENEELELKEKGLDKLLITYVFSNNEEIKEIVKPVEKIEITTYGNETIEKNGDNDNFEEIGDKGDISLLNIENKDIHKTTIKEGTVEYTEKLKLDLGYRKEASNITIEDISSDFYNNEEEIDEETKLKYIRTKIDKEMLINLLGEEGKLTIKDNSTDKVLVELTKEYIEDQELDTKINQNFEEENTTEEDAVEENVVEENRSNITITADYIEIEYVVDVQKIKISIENMKPQSESNIEESNFVIENTKSIFDVKELEALKCLKEEIKYVLEEEKTTNSVIIFKDTITRAKLELDNTEWVVGQANKVNYKIVLDTTTEKSELYVNPLILLELPTGVESVNEKNSEFTVRNDNGVFTNKKVFVATVLGKQYVAIKLEGAQSDESIANGDTEIDLGLELNIKEVEEQTNETTRLYYQNSAAVTAYESGAGFDSAEVDVSLVLNNEQQEEIVENNEAEEENNNVEENNNAEEIVETEEINANINAYVYTTTNEIIKQGEEIEYILQVNNCENEELQNVKVIDIVPEGVTLQKVIEVIQNDETLEYDTEKEIDYEYNEQNREITVNLDKLNPATKKEVYNEEKEKMEDVIETDSRTIKIFVIANSLEENVYTREITNRAKLLINKNTILETECTNVISDIFLNIEAEPLNENINERENITIGLKIKNEGLIDAKKVKVNIQIPEEIDCKSVEEIILEEDKEITKTEATLSNDNYELDVDILAGKTCYIKISGTIKDVEQTKQLEVKGMVNEETVTWNTQIVNIYDEIDDNNPTNPDNPEDPNKPVDSNNPNNPDNSNEPSDQEKPDKPNNPGNPENSENPNNQNKDGFDLSLKQNLNKITVTNSQGTTVYEYKDTNFAKVEIPSKYMNGTVVAFEYEIIVKNEGTIPGYARKIVDYVSKDLKFNSELNSDWYLGDDGNLYSVALIDKLLKPGETAILNIILTKQMTNTNTGTITNIAEIYEASNDANVEDINSIPGDKLDGQNDMSKVEVIVAVRTGEIIIYIILAMVVIVIIGFGIEKINKKVIINKKGGC